MLTATLPKKAVSSARPKSNTLARNWRRPAVVSGSTSSTWPNTRRPSEWNAACMFCRTANEFSSLALKNMLLTFIYNEN